MILNVAESIQLVIHFLTPPMTETVRTPRGRPNFVASSSIWRDQEEKSLNEISTQEKEQVKNISTQGQVVCLPAVPTLGLGLKSKHMVPCQHQYLVRS